MANPYINIYKNNPTEGDVDGTCVSTDGTYTAPISAVLNSDPMSGEYRKTVKLAIRTEEGYQTVGETEIYTQLTVDSLSTARDFDNRFELLWEPEYVGENEELVEENIDVSAGKIMTLNPIGSKNKIFWLNVYASSDEIAQIDKSVRLVVKAKVAQKR